MKIKVIPILSRDTPPKPYYKITIEVTPQGHIINASGIYSTEEAAEKRKQELINKFYSREQSRRHKANGRK